ncbi:CYFA0S03e05424g1_1 [Cyberlindnera fabianii]|uniref:DASH complex subunit DAD4 n=1 Tax=Cyberlindnera fabianii TaxID=36022 RepID=A0A061AR35_CYBFA|nr:CYFA0S03e05424g1_1 [Cyberlindnera fabianii]
MENPHEQVQNALLARIINNVERLNESVSILNNTLRVSYFFHPIIHSALD